MSLADKARTAKYLVNSAMHSWSGRAISGLSPRRAHDLTRELERAGTTLELDLDTPSWRTDRIVGRTSLIDDIHTISLPAHDPLVRESRTWQRYQVRQLHDVAVDVSSGLVFSADRVIAQSGGGTRTARDSSFVSGATFRVKQGPRKDSTSVVSPLGDLWHHYHFMIETLPRMLHAQAFEPNVLFVTSQPIPDRYQVLLDRLSLPVQVLEHGVVLAAKTVILVDPPERFWPRPADVSVLRSALGTFETEGSKYFLGRNNASRRPGDEVELGAELRHLGYTPIELAEYPVLQQWEIVARASAVVGAHGAALSNIAAMNPGTHVVEITSGELFESCYRRLAEVSTIKYRIAYTHGSPNDPFGHALDALPFIANAQMSETFRET